MTNHAKEFGTEIRSTSATAVRKKGDLFEVETTEGILKSKTIILATGGSPNYLGVKGEKEYWTKGVSYCAICDGPLPIFRNKPMMVVGGGDAALEEGMYLTKHASKLFLVHRRSEFRAAPIIQDRARKNEKMELVMDSVVEEVGRQRSARMGKGAQRENQRGFHPFPSADCSSISVLSPTATS